MPEPIDVIIIDSYPGSVSDGSISLGNYVLRPELIGVSGALQYQIDNITIGTVNTGSLTGNFYPLSSNPSGYLTPSQTGQFYSIVNPNNYSTSGNLLSTSGILQSQINNLGTGTELPDIAGNNGKVLAVIDNSLSWVSGIYDANDVNITNGSIVVSNFTCGNVDITNGVAILNSDSTYALQVGGAGTQSNGYGNTQFYINSTASEVGIAFNNAGAGGQKYNIQVTNDSSSLGGGKFTINNATDGESILSIDNQGKTTFAHDVTINQDGSLVLGGQAALHSPSNNILGVYRGDWAGFGDVQANQFIGNSFISGSTNIGDLFYPRNSNPSGYIPSSGGAVSVVGGGTILNGQLLIGSSGENSFIQGGLYGLSGINIISGNGQIGIAFDNSLIPAGSGGFVWDTVTGNTNISENHGYITAGNSLVNLLLPATAAIGSEVKVTARTLSGWKITQSAGNTIYFGDMQTTQGTGGYLQFTQNRDSVGLVCVDVSGWNVISSVGNLIVN